METDIQRLLVHYSGRVQGVGFRFTAVSIAREFQVGGYVKNLPDGRVQLEAEGQPDEVQRFLAAIAAEFPGNIHRAEITSGLAPQGESQFTVQY